MKIAVIDDERPARKMLIRRVKEVLPDCEITEAESGADALKMFNESDSFDLIFVDMDLGDMEGTTLAATAKNCFPGRRSSLPPPIPSMPRKRTRWRSMIIF